MELILKFTPAKYKFLYGMFVAMFVLLSFVVAALIPVCYVPRWFLEPHGIIPALSWVMDANPPDMVWKILLADRAVAAQACVALLMYVSAEYCFHRHRQIRRSAVGQSLLEQDVNQEGLATKLSKPGTIQTLALNDPVRVFLEGLAARFRDDAAKVNPEASLEILQRRLLRENDLRFWAKVMIVLGLLGMLLGLYIGFVLYAAPGGQGDLRALINQSIIVVAAAALSSVVGIGLGELVVSPLAGRLDLHNQRFLDVAIALENALELSRLSPSTPASPGRP